MKNFHCSTSDNMTNFSLTQSFRMTSSELCQILIYLYYFLVTWGDTALITNTIIVCGFSQQHLCASLFFPEDKCKGLRNPMVFWWLSMQHLGERSFLWIWCIVWAVTFLTISYPLTDSEDGGNGIKNFFSTGWESSKCL